MAVTGTKSELQKQRLDVEELKIGAKGSKTTIDGNQAAVLGTINTSDKLVKCVKVAALTATGNAGMLSWANPEGATILVTGFAFDVTTQATGTPTVNIGVDADGTGSADTVIDGAAVGAAVVLLNNVDDQGTNGQAVVKLTSTQYLTCTASADPAGLVGSFYITYILA